MSCILLNHSRYVCLTSALASWCGHPSIHGWDQQLLSRAIENAITDEWMNSRYSRWDEEDRKRCGIFQFVQSLRDWNVAAYLERYKHFTENGREDEYAQIVSVTKELLFEGIEFCSNPLSVLLPVYSTDRIPETFKALDCTDYQCLDAPGYESSTTRKILTQVRRGLADYYITTSEQYDQAPWA